MSIADKLQTILENEQKVYNAGYEKGKSEGGGGGTDTSDATATSEDILLYKTAYAKGKKLTGSIPLQFAKTITPSASEQVAISSGYYASGDVKVQGDANLTAENIKKGATIFGVEGNYEGGGGSEDSSSQWFANYINNNQTGLEIYNDKLSGTLRAYAFYENSAVTRIELPNVEYLKERCFNGCANLKTLLLPNLVGYTYQYMAAGCTSLGTVDVHNASYVSSYSFQSCTSLKKIDLHKVETIGTYAFSGATKFDTLIIRTDSVPTLSGTNAFTSTKIKSGGTGYIYVKAALVDSFKSASNWSTFASQIRAIEDYPDITGG